MKMLECTQADLLLAGPGFNCRNPDRQRGTDWVILAETDPAFARVAAEHPAAVKDALEGNLEVLALLRDTRYNAFDLMRLDEKA